jgi:hypothetical protein
MKRRTILGTCLVVTCGVIAMFASSASAALPAPVWAVCSKAPKVNKKVTGKWKNKTCTEEETKGEGSYERTPGIGKGKAFKGKTGVTRLDVQSPFGDDAVECTSTKGKAGGKPAAPNKEIEAFVELKGCELTLFNNKTGDPCFTTGLKEGEMKVTGMAGELGYIEESPEVKVGLRFENEAKPGGVIVEFNCAYKVEPAHPNHELIIKNGKVFGQMIGEEKGFLAGANKESELVLEGKEQYGTHEFEGKKYKPIVNFVGWAEEVPGIIAAEEANEEETDPAHVLKGEFCGAFVEGVLKKECTPPAYAGLTGTTKNKGEALLIET